MPAGWVSAGVAVVGGVESYMNNQDAKSAANKNNANAAQLAGAQGTMLNQAQGIADQPFQAYTGTMTAPMSGNQQQGYTLANKAATDGVAQADNAAATGLVGQVANNSVFDSAAAQKYMNPYTQGVTDAAVTASNKQYLQNLSAIQTGAAGSGAFGGSRQAISEATLRSNQNMNVGSLTATGNANAYDSAFKSWQADNNTKLAAATAYENAGQDVTQMNSAQISDLMKTGGVSQVIAQTDLANQYQQFMRQQNWSSDRLGSLINAVGAAKGSLSQSVAPASNAANQLLGLGSTVAGLFGGSSSSTGNYANSGAPSSAEISQSTSGIGNIDVGAIDTGSMPDVSFAGD